ncbi:MAG: methyltransferase domain-containing protein [Candidatus Omnitrophota bacterium]
METKISRAVTRAKEKGGSVPYKDYPCDLCGSREATLLPHCMEYTQNEAINICNQCGFVYVPRRRSFTDIAKAWSQDIYSETDINTTAAEQVYTSRIPAIKARQVFVAEFIHSTIGLRGKSVCDIGAGEGQFLEIIRTDDYGAQVFGIEPSSKNCRLLTKNGIENFLGTIEDYAASKKFAEGQFDIVTIMWTMENSASCRDMMTIAHRLLKKGGHVVVATGSRLLVPFKKTLEEYLGKTPQDTHAFRFSAKTLRGLMKISDFAAVHENHWRDHDVLCVIGRKTEEKLGKAFEGDHYLEVYNFFERWHVESKMYYSEK